MLKNRSLATHALAATLSLVAASSAWSQVKSPESDFEWHKSPRPAIDQPERKQVFTSYDSTPWKRERYARQILQSLQY